MTSVGKDLEILECFCIAGNNVKWLCKTIRSFLKKLNIELSYDPAPRYNLKEMKAGTQIETCKPMFIATLFTIARKWFNR